MLPPPDNFGKLELQTKKKTFMKESYKEKYPANKNEFVFKARQNLDELLVGPINLQVSKTKTILDLKWRFFHKSDTKALCSWIRSRYALKLICSDDGEVLTPKIINFWIHHALLSVIVSDINENTQVGFFTLSYQEAKNISMNTVELCHLMVKPQKNYFAVGEYICNLAKVLAAELGFSLLIGRVVPSNIFGLALARSEGFEIALEKATWTTADFTWFYYEIPILQNSNEGVTHGIQRFKNKFENLRDFSRMES